MKMRSRRAASRTDIRHDLTARDRVANIDLDLRQMSVTRFQPVAMIDLDHVSVATFPSGFGDDTARRCDDLVTALAVDVHSGMELIGPSAEGASPKAELVVDLAHVGPDRRDKCLIAGCLDGDKLFFDLGVLGC